MDEDKNKFRPGFEVEFVSENILVQTLAHYIATHDGDLPSELILHKIMKACVDGALFFDMYKKKSGIGNRLID